MALDHWGHLEKRIDTSVELPFLPGNNDQTLKLLITQLQESMKRYKELRQKQEQLQRDRREIDELVHKLEESMMVQQMDLMAEIRKGAY